MYTVHYYTPGINNRPNTWSDCPTAFAGENRWTDAGIRTLYNTACSDAGFRVLEIFDNRIYHIKQMYSKPHRKKSTMLLTLCSPVCYTKRVAGFRSLRRIHSRCEAPMRAWRCCSHIATGSQELRLYSTLLACRVQIGANGGPVSGYSQNRVKLNKV